MRDHYVAIAYLALLGLEREGFSAAPPPPNLRPPEFSFVTS